MDEKLALLDRNDATIAARAASSSDLVGIFPPTRATNVWLASPPTRESTRSPTLDRPAPASTALCCNASVLHFLPLSLRAKRLPQESCSACTMGPTVLYPSAVALRVDEEREKKILGTLPCLIPRDIFPFSFQKREEKSSDPKWKVSPCVPIVFHRTLAIGSASNLL